MDKIPLVTTYKNKAYDDACLYISFSNDISRCIKEMEESNIELLYFISYRRRQYSAKLLKYVEEGVVNLFITDKPINNSINYYKINCLYYRDYIPYFVLNNAQNLELIGIFKDNYEIFERLKSNDMYTLYVPNKMYLYTKENLSKLEDILLWKNQNVLLDLI